MANFLDQLKNLLNKPVKKVQNSIVNYASQPKNQNTIQDILRFEKPVQPLIQAGNVVNRLPFLYANTAIDIGKNAIKTANRTGSLIGKGIIAPFDANNIQSMTNTDINEADKYVKTAIKIRSTNPKLSQELFARAKNLTQGASRRAQSFVDVAEKNKKEMIAGGVKTGLYSLGGASLIQKPLQMVAASSIGGILNKAQGGTFDRGFKEGLDTAVKFEGITPFTNPVIAGLVGKSKTLVNNPIVKQVAARSLSGLGAVGENEILGKLEGRKINNSERLLSFAVGSVLSSGGKIQDWNKLKKDTKNLIVSGGKRFGQDIRPAHEKWVMSPDDPRRNIPVFLYDALNKAKRGDYNIGLQARPIGGNESILSADKKNFTPFTKEQMKIRGETMKFAETVTKKSGGVVPETVKNVNKGIQEGKYQYDPMTFKAASEKALQNVSSPQGLSQKISELSKDEIKDPGQHIADAKAVYDKLILEGRQPEADAILDSTIEKLTKMGQGISLSRLFLESTPQGQARIILRSIQNTIDNASFIDKTFRTKKGTLQITDEFKTKLQNDLKAAQLLEGKEKEAASMRILQNVADYVPTGADDFITSLRYNSMLSNPRTQAKNLYSNLIQTGFTRPVTKFVSGDIKGATKYYIGAIKSLPKAWDAFGSAWHNFNSLTTPKGEITPSSISDLLQGRVKKQKGNAFDTATKITTLGQWATRFLESTDKFFSTIIAEGEMAGGKSPEEATKIAEKYLFRAMFDPNNETGQGKLLSGIDKIASWISNGPKFIRWFVPFIKTPTQVLKQSLEYSPLGITTLPGSANKKEQLAKAAIGTGFTVFGGMMAANDRTTWDVPKDEKQKELFFASGKKPYSVLIGNQWVPMQYFGIFAPTIAAAAAAKHYSTENNSSLTDSQIQKIGKTIEGMTKYYTDQSFLSGLGQFVDLATGNQDVNLASIAAFTGGQIIPQNALISYISKVIDPVYRKADDTFIQQFIKNIPFASSSLPAYTTPTGEESKRNIWQMLFPAPYETGTQNIPFQNMEDERIQKLQQNNVLNETKKALEKGDIDTVNKILGNVPKQEIPIQETKNPTSIEDILNNKYQEEERGASMREVLKLTQIPYQQRVSTLLKQGYTESEIKNEEMKALKSLDLSTKTSYVQDQISKGNTDFTTLYKNELLTPQVAKQLERQGYIQDADTLMKNMKMTDVYYQNKEIRRLQKSSMKKILTLQKNTMKKILNRKTKTIKYKPFKIPKPKKMKKVSYKFPKIKLP